MIIALYIAAAVIMAVGNLYFAGRSRGFRKLLAGAFFVSSGILFYLFLAECLCGGQNLSRHRGSAASRSVVHFILFLVCFYFGFIRQPRA